MNHCIFVDDDNTEVKRNETIVGILSAKKSSIFFMIPDVFE
jgi:hypothetical protein